MFLLCQFQQSGLEIQAPWTNKNRQHNSRMMSQLTHDINR